MRTVDTLEARCVRIAAARWPRDVRDEQAAEWSAELHELRHDTSVSAWRRQWQRLSFVVSLLTMPAYRDRQGKGFHMPRLNVMGRRIAMFIAIGALCAVVQSAPGMVGRALIKPVVADILSVTVILLSVVLLAALGYRLGARQPIVGESSSGVDRLKGAAIAMAGVGGTVALLVGQHGYGAVVGWLMFPVWMVAFIPLLTHVMRQANKGRTLAAWCWGLGGGLLLWELLAIPLGIGYATQEGRPLSQVDLTDAPLWLARGVVSDYGSWFAQSYGGGVADPEFLTEHGLATVLPALLPATAFLLTYLARSARATWLTVPGLQSAEAKPTPGTPAVRQLVGLTTCALAVIGWAAIAAFLAPVADRVGHDAPMAWAIELRQAAILLAAITLAWTLLGRAGALLPAVGLGVSLLAVDIVAERLRMTGTGGFLLLAGVGGAVLLVGWWLATNLDKRVPDAAARRRRLVALAILTAYCAPAVQWQAESLNGGYESEGVDSPVALSITTTVLMVALAVVAMSAANAARNRPLSSIGLVAVSVVPVALMLGTGFLTWNGLPVVPDGTGALLGLPLCVYTLAVITWDAKPSTVRVLLWTAVGVVSFPVALGVAFVGLFLSAIIGGLLLVLRDSYGAELIVASPIVLVGILPLAAVGALLVARKPVPGESEPAREPGLEPVRA